MSWDLARVWHALAEQQPDRPAIVHGSQTLTWDAFDTAAATFAQTLRDGGVRRGDVVALCLPNVLAYLVLVAGAMRCGATPCGINHRYRPDELVTLLRHIAPAAVCYDPQHEADVAKARSELPGVSRWYGVEDDSLAEACAGGQLDTEADRSRLDSRPDDVLLKCTGGTTGSAAAVRWRIGDVLTQLNDHNPWRRHDLTGASLRPAPDHPVRLLLASPLNHGSGLTRALGALCAGGTVITLPDTGFDPSRVLDTLAQQHATSLAIVGDAHALPLADALDAAPQRWRLPDLATITSSGVAWTHNVKQRMLHHLPRLRLLESLGATEATGLGFSVTTTQVTPRTGEFRLGTHAMVFTDGRPARPGETGSVGVSRPHPLGLHPTGHLPTDRFLEHRGTRYLLSADHVQLLHDRRFQHLGRAGDCINTGGEKVYGPHVADVLLRHPGVLDALVLGSPHPRFGHAVTALVTLTPGTTTDAVRAHAKAHLAGFKVPAAVIDVPAIPRTGVGKPDLAAAHAVAAHALTTRHLGGTA